MDLKVYIPLLLSMMLTTYLVRAIPFVLFRRKLKNPKVKAFFAYIPYTVLTAMTFPSILYSTGNIVSAAAGLVAALVLAYKEKSLLTVAIGSCIASIAVTLIFMAFGLTL